MLYKTSNNNDAYKFECYEGEKLQFTTDFFTSWEACRDYTNEIETRRQEIVDANNAKSKKIDDLNSKTLNNIKQANNDIVITYQITDKSGFFNNLNKKYLENRHTIGAGQLPKKEEFYYKMPSSIPNRDNYEIHEQLKSLYDFKAYTQVKKKIDEQGEQLFQDYQNRLKSASKLRLVGESDGWININDHIAFYVKFDLPEQEIQYIPGKKMTITIPAVVEYVDVKGMVPKEYALQDANFNMLMRADSGLGINGIMSNKTQSFLTVKSLTSYYQGLVFNVSNLDKELAPEARDLDDGTRYSLITSSMSEKSNFEKMTKSKAQAIKINYGYAVKYKINDTNIEKAIYNTKNYSLYDIIQQYL